ncbi:tRNA (N6-threonylcarbamoyladenosine(37)-N6)-methyltransferase TrmO [Methanosarcina sp.]|uniref:tRNA (N6-threonylcarbamoyladenosine(37)-N6)-methyltransferase TrmO n=1 Tax=Methanosarcina sp. TaxID=2213 RepID=UPI0029887B5A|nr:tRNA (N6-threonylcarbamoyladenosine(37)-N6)-methyltransferase TrmO [Methanosarcina sp.]MDW5550045.1 tRNA (N6-threonylcarbamoyladenosine(37)-N6)-methyltransferase TrmO [Methanosarcina sp.]MDW5553999.1 tRNA (N6-threonylcarbamoyladenosine(37)-N6)-methyltransferase TrmO [Methanosarcina sp.]MDW5558496.1 tRNA (N6-threonylcarbamoyladenosine(37)-N6)-methyltransferase TrmO [Methanosarcina sp.]
MNENPEVSERIEMVPVGYVENDYLEPVYNEEVYSKVSKIVLMKEFTDGLYRIEDFEKLYILFYFSKSKGYKLIHRRRYDGEVSGVFASRSPYRPNGIGLTIVELLNVEGNVLHVRGLDAINGTPVLDIKPYIREAEEEDEKQRTEKEQN